MKTGRPTSYDPRFCKMLIDHMSQGFSYETFASEVDVSRSTIYKWEEDYPEFSDAKKRAFLKCMKFWETIGIAQAIGDKKHGRGSTASWIFNMKNRFGWTDRHQMIDSDQEDIEWIE